MRHFLIAAVVGAGLGLMPPGLSAQEAADTALQQEPAAPKFTVGQLLAQGFDVKAMSYVNGAIVLVLQGGVDAFVCETSPMGESRLCIALK